MYLIESLDSDTQELVKRLGTIARQCTEEAEFHATSGRRNLGLSWQRRAEDAARGWARLLGLHEDFPGHLEPRHPSEGW